MLLYNFSDFECSKENSPDYSCHFWNHKVRVFSNFVSLFCVMKDKSSVFLAQTPYNLDKNSPSKWNLWTFEWLGENLPNSLLKPQINFSSNFASLFDVMRDKSSVFFYLKLYMIFTKGVHQSAKFQTFDLSGEISPNLNFDRLLLLKAYKISVENLQRSYVSW